ncbi:hypothetical protein BCR34DRAFT_258966 [Clohesyomyces aquaticus]|uniref:Uncharacterized protein n=1 Tax=Clohesyomyces aquaticus TaxID=1231657 RepID=A0A1Y2A8V5_9PLEO|nr:hypothetical protein BCR34DRAFT_258966 [Clohesyomyces aquaticus]
MSPRFEDSADFYAHCLPTLSQTTVHISNLNRQHQVRPSSLHLDLLWPELLTSHTGHMLSKPGKDGARTIETMNADKCWPSPDEICRIGFDLPHGSKANQGAARIRTTHIQTSGGCDSKDEAGLAEVDRVEINAETDGWSKAVVESDPDEKMY